MTVTGIVYRMFMNLPFSLYNNMAVGTNHILMAAVSYGLCARRPYLQYNQNQSKIQYHMFVQAAIDSCRLCSKCCCNEKQVFILDDSAAVNLTTLAQQTAVV